MKGINTRIKVLPPLVEHILIISFIMLISLVPRLWKLSIYPGTIVDEPADLRDINIILAKGFSATDIHWDWSKSYLAYIFPIFFIKVLKMPADIYTLRLSTVFLSILAIPPFFFLVKKYTNSHISFLTSLLFSHSYYFLQFSRVGGWINIMFVTTVGLYLFWLLEKFRERKNIYLTVLSGFLTGLIFYSYRSGWIYIGVSFILLSYSLVKLKFPFFRFFLFLFTFIVMFVITIFPWVNKIRLNWEMYYLRPNVVSIKNVETPYHGLYEKSEIYSYQIETSLKSWLLLQALDGGGDENPRYLPLRYPPVNNFVRVGFWIGLILAMTSFSKTFYWYIVIVLGLILGQILTVNPPNGARGLIMLPFIYLFFSLALNKFISLQKNKFVKSIVVIIVLLIGYTDFLFYQYWMTWIKV